MENFGGCRGVRGALVPPWSVYRCIGDRPLLDGLLDERIVALTNQDGSGRTQPTSSSSMAAEPGLAVKLPQALEPRYRPGCPSGG